MINYGDFIYAFFIGDQVIYTFPLTLLRLIGLTEYVLGIALSQCHSN